MRASKRSYQLWQIMLAIAVLAGLFAFFGVTPAVAILIATGAIVLPIVLAGPGRRRGAAAWASSLYPLLLLVSLCATGFTAWSVLGHRPRASLDDPKFISPLVEVPYISTYLCVMSAPFILGLSIPLMLAHVGQRIWRKRILPGKATALMLLPLLIWLPVFAILNLGLFEVRYIGEWYMD